MLDRPGKDRSWRKPEPQNSPLGSVPARPEGHDLAGSPVSLTQHQLGMARGFPSNWEKVISIPDLEGCLSQLTLKNATPRSPAGRRACTKHARSRHGTQQMRL